MTGIVDLWVFSYNTNFQALKTTLKQEEYGYVIL